MGLPLATLFRRFSLGCRSTAQVGQAVPPARNHKGLLTHDHH
jgi:hypothetical protein